MARYFIDGSAANTLAADEALHAGITRKLYQDNLGCAYETSRYDYDGLHFDSLLVGSGTSAADEWELSDVTPFVLPVYPKEGGGYRSFKFHTEATTGNKSASLRIYLLPFREPPGVDATDGVIGFDTYATISGITPSYTVIASDEVTPDDSCVVSQLFAPTATGGVYVKYVYVHILVQASGATTNAIRGLRVVEGD